MADTIHLLPTKPATRPQLDPDVEAFLRVMARILRRQLNEMRSNETHTAPRIQRID